MRRSEIRPHTIYRGRNGCLRKVKQVQVDVDGNLYVIWQAVGRGRNREGNRWASESIGTFARWAVGITKTLSSDLQHYFLVS